MQCLRRRDLVRNLRCLFDGEGKLLNEPPQMKVENPGPVEVKFSVEVKLSECLFDGEGKLLNEPPPMKVENPGRSS